MNFDSKKMNLAEETLNVNNEETLIKIEEVLNKSTSHNRKQSIFDFVGIISEEDAIEMKKAIKETCENIHPDDWE